MRGELTRLKDEAKRLLEAGDVSLVVGYARADDGVGSRPAFVVQEKELDTLIMDARAQACLPSLVFMAMTEDPAGEDRVAVVVKGCDSRAVEQLVADHRLDPQRLVLLGAPCDGIVDEEKLSGAVEGEVVAVHLRGDEFVVITPDDQEVRLKADDFLAQKCRSCTRHNPEGADVLLGDESEKEDAAAPDYGSVKDLENMTAEEKHDFWLAELSKCIRCYACRNVCPACNCRVCIFEQDEPRWAEETGNPAQHGMYQFIRAWHVAGRCVDCWECQRVCPAGIPLMLLNHKLMKDIGELFGVERPFEASEKEPLAQYSLEDPDDFE